VLVSCLFAKIITSNARTSNARSKKKRQQPAERKLVGMNELRQSRDY
jgi:hypothetical protein